MLDFGFYNIDCMQGMKEFPDNYFDLAIVDPPYGAGFTEGGGCQGWFSKYHQNPENTDNIGSGGTTGSGRDSTGTSRTHYVFGVRKSRPSYESRRKLAEQIRKKIIAWDVAPDKAYFQELFRISRNQIIWGGELL